ncbi:galactosyltransferase-related protein [Serratia sp. M24T3]|uniref:galactosyltransferase-related protein n=1 Tax=Serratia sp. M24T3 TaxID=932213 RepID=UPI00025BA808|nr:galactosyltransferase-related protein [Serratia sp. M24T3]EIC82164.1 hypothetical protein SPM24T3_23312 [Serratia sp. M24T3]
MKIGVGVITMGMRTINPKMFANTACEVFIYTDKDKKGPGAARNEVLKHFSGYDHVFIFDDDCYPTAKGWEKYFIDCAINHDIHYMALPEGVKGTFLGAFCEITHWDSALGCFVYQDAHAMRTIGGYNTAYHRYGYEDAGRSIRAKKAKLTGCDAWSFPLRGLLYIHSEDVCGECPVPNIEHADKLAYIEMNRPVWLEEINGNEVYYPYE